MIPPLTGLAPLTTRIPRESGDDPFLIPTPQNQNPYSPRERGRSGELFARFRYERVFPARAKIIPILENYLSSLEFFAGIWLFIQLEGESNRG